jgi:hypothetical protein
MPRLLRERQDALLDLAIDRVVGDLHEVDRLRAHHLFDLGVAPSFRRRDTDVAQPPGALHLEQARQMILPRQGCGPASGRSSTPPERARRFDLRPAGATSPIQTFSAENRAGGAADLRERVAYRRLRRTVHRADESISRPPAAKNARTTRRRRRAPRGRCRR